MLDFTRTRIEAIENTLVHTMYPISAEGLALQHIFEAGLGKVRATDGTASSIFAGFSMSQNMSSTTSVFVETLTVPTSAPYTVTLSQVPTANTDMLVKDTSGSVYAYNVGVAAGQYGLSGAVVTFNSAQAGATVSFTYRYALTVAQQSALFGDQPIGRTATSITNTITAITKGLIFTDQFDPSADWGSVSLNTTIVNGGVGGRLYIGGTGAPIGTFSRIIAIPTSDYPFLGVRVGH